MGCIWNGILFIVIHLALASPSRAEVFSNSGDIQSPEWAQNLRSQFQKNRDQFRSGGLENPSLILNLLAPRFFDPDAWKQAQENQAHPGSIYQPVTTWAHWVRAEVAMEEKAMLNLQSGKIPPIDLAWLKGLYASAMGASIENVELRNEDILGLALVPRNRLSADEFKSLQMRLVGENELLRFYPTRCDAEFPKGIHHFRDIPPEQLHALILSQDSLVLQEQISQNAICGFFLYPEVERVSSLLQGWIEDFNNSLNSKSEEDPFVFATRMARTLVVIHPFPDGNGRLSRLIQDYILLSRGLPPPIFEDMNKDTLRTASQWVDEMKTGSLRYLQFQKDCLDVWRVGEPPSQTSYRCSRVDLKKMIPRTSILPGAIPF